MKFGNFFSGFFTFSAILARWAWGKDSEENLKFFINEGVIPPELDGALRCLIRTWIRREMPKRFPNMGYIPSEMDLPPAQQLNSCTPEALSSAGLPQDQYLIGGDRIWNAISGWITRKLTFKEITPRSVSNFTVGRPIVGKFNHFFCEKNFVSNFNYHVFVKFSDHWLTLQRTGLTTEYGRGLRRKLFRDVRSRGRQRSRDVQTFNHVIVMFSKNCKEFSKNAKINDYHSGVT
jgi:hypothetical protein